MVMSMPSHKIHIGIGQELKNFYRSDKDLFLLGTILPDLGKDHFKSHFKKNHSRYDIAEFVYRRYDKDDPVLAGYLVHLLTDEIYNEYVRDNKFLYDENHILNGIKTNNGAFYGTPKEVCDKKQEGFYDYEYFLLNNSLIEPLNMVDLSRLTNIEECNYDKDYIEEYINKHNEDIANNKNEPKYEIFTFEELDYLYNETIRKTKNFLKNINRVENYKKLYYN